MCRFFLASPRINNTLAKVSSGTLITSMWKAERERPIDKLFKDDQEVTVVFIDPKSSDKRETCDLCFMFLIIRERMIMIHVEWEMIRDYPTSGCRAVKSSTNSMTCY